MSKSHLLKYLLISPNLPVGGFCYSEGLESYLNNKNLKDSNSVKELIISELKIGQIKLDARLLIDFFDIFNELNDGDILSTNASNFYVEIIAKTENLIEISSNSKIELIKTAYHLGNRHVEVEIEEDILLTKNDYVIENMLKNFKVDVKNLSLIHI